MIEPVIGNGITLGKPPISEAENSERHPDEGDKRES